MIRGLGCRAVHIGGGEPFARATALGDVVAGAARHGLAVEYVETNSSWYVDPEQARAVLEVLRARGLDTLLVSISPFHNAAIPFFKVKGVLAACRRVGMQTFPWVADFVTDIDSFDDSTAHSMSEYEERFGGDYLGEIRARYWIHLGGRALATFARALESRSCADILAANGGGCAELTRTDHFHIDLHGNYVPGLCAGLAIRMEDLGKPLVESDYPLISALYRHGVRGLYDLVAAEHDFRPRRRGYLSKCDLCDHLRSHLAGRELAPAGFYAGSLSRSATS